VGEEEHVLFSIVGDELRVERLRSQLVSSARYRVSQTSLKELAARCRPDAVVWHAGDRQAAEAGRRLCEAAVVSMSGQASASSGGPVGVETLAAALAEARDTLEDVIEPYLIQEGLVLRTARGRVLGRPGWQHLGLVPPPPPAQPDLLTPEGLAEDE